MNATDTHRRRRATGRAAIPLIVIASMLGSATMLSADDFWVVPNAFVLAKGSMLELRGQTSSLFPTSKSAVAVERVADARLLGDTGETVLADRSIAGTSLLFRHRVATVGQRIVAVAIHPRSVRETPASFRRYMVLEGAPEAIERYEREGRLPPSGSSDSLTRRYSKYAKTFIQVGRGGARAFRRLAGHPLEFVPLSDPAALRSGDTLAVRVLLLGRPLVGAHVHAGSVESFGARTLTDTAAARRSSVRDRSVVSDADGVARIVIVRGGMWNVRGLQILPADKGSGADWDVYWATMVFDLPQSESPRVGRAGLRAIPALSPTP